MKQPLDKKLAISLPILIVIIISVSLTIHLQRQNSSTSDPNLNPSSSENSNNKDIDMKTINITINNHQLDVDLEDNPATTALLEKLEAGSILINMEDYGGFEKVGELGFSLPTSDEELTTAPGDLVLYEGNKLTLHYGSNSWSYTKLGHIVIPTEDLKTILSPGNVAITLSLE